MSLCQTSAGNKAIYLIVVLFTVHLSDICLNSPVKDVYTKNLFYNILVTEICCIGV